MNAVMQKEEWQKHKSSSTSMVSFIQERQLSFAYRSQISLTSFTFQRQLGHYQLTQIRPGITDVPGKQRSVMTLALTDGSPVVI